MFSRRIANKLDTKWICQESISKFRYGHLVYDFSFHRTHSHNTSNTDRQTDRRTDGVDWTVATVTWQPHDAWHRSDCRYHISQTLTAAKVILRRIPYNRGPKGEWWLKLQKITSRKPKRHLAPDKANLGQAAAERVGLLYRHGQPSWHWITNSVTVAVI